MSTTPRTCIINFVDFNQAFMLVEDRTNLLTHRVDFDVCTPQEQSDTGEWVAIPVEDELVLDVTCETMNETLQSFLREKAQRIANMILM
jgi:hypothetical protein